MPLSSKWNYYFGWILAAAVLFSVKIGRDTSSKYNNLTINTTHKKVSTSKSSILDSTTRIKEYHPSTIALPTTSNSCTPRTEYPYKSFYGLADKDYPPDFLKHSAYIYGQAPRILKGDVITKLCSSKHAKARPLDGTNPSILSIDRIRRLLKGTRSEDLLLLETLLEDFPTATYLMTLTYKWTHQCQLLSENVQRDNNFEVDLVFVDSNLDTLLQTTIARGNFPLDDARLFLASGGIWISALSAEFQKEKGYVVDYQIFGKLGLEYNAHAKEISAVLSESTLIKGCCGRNMAPIMRDNNDGGSSPLEILTWLDPLRIVSTDISLDSWGGGGVRSIDLTRRRLQQEENFANFKPPSFHGTSGALVYVPALDEYIGIGHFHRDGPSPMEWGHHYTHAFFTISSLAPYQMKRLSGEFVLESFRKPSDADIVQFASGLEFVTAKSGQDYFWIAYGINDCESGAILVPAEAVYQMLQPVEPNTRIWGQVMKQVDNFV